MAVQQLLLCSRHGRGDHGEVKTLSPAVVGFPCPQGGALRQWLGLWGLWIGVTIKVYRALKEIWGGKDNVV